MIVAIGTVGMIRVHGNVAKLASFGTSDLMGSVRIQPAEVEHGLAATGFPVRHGSAEQFVDDAVFLDTCQPNVQAIEIDGQFFVIEPEAM